MEHMPKMTLAEFIDQNTPELIRRCRVKVASRQSPPTSEADIDGGVRLFLSQLSDELRHGASATNEISRGATQQGHDLLVRGFTISQVVHGYGDVCQAITDLAVETDAPISTDDFRTLNRCLDDAIAGAVTEFSREQDLTRDGESQEVQALLRTATTAFGVLQTGNVGVGGSTGALVLRSLRAIEALLNRQAAPIAQPVTARKTE
jgi:hypothetical protein